MTLSERNGFFKTAIIFCAISTLFVIASSFLVVPIYSTIEENTRRPQGILQIPLNLFFTTEYLAVHISIFVVVLFSFIGIFLIHSFFEQTPAPEILYLAFFTISFSFESIRLIIPLYYIFTFPSLYFLIAGRILLFIRYFGIFSLFAASVYAAGLEVQRTRTVVTLTIVSALAITIGAPIDTQIWDTSLNLIYGFRALFRLTESITIIITIVSFLIAVNIRGSKEYANIGIGLAAALLGRYLLLNTDNWAALSGILFLSIGVWLACSRLHKIYLWL